ncbi:MULTISPECIES: S-layer family protein [unclassified Coleofasciculus]|uniref:two-partner secretion domain-containing protein n=1 Tax=Cyanophyceae TaxID=3028117 RepID=UPI00168330BD|nr:S-layer family protein [Coleofasciculus sp. FACHB-SPT9]MBD2085353.1 S-layer family protein [Coleofasciculus sp. FACHB-542]
MNPKRWLQQTLQLGLVCSLAIVGALFKVSRVCAQIVPDETLGTESSVVVPVAPGIPVEFIFSGATRDSNLFHSFKQFDIGEIGAAYFLPPPAIKNILSRVTGGSRCEILGTLGVIGDANLFLINPNGILFGSKASLDIGGSFVATTANAIAFDTQGFFSASAPNVPPVLTVNPSAFLFNQIAPQPIVIQSSEIGLQVPDGRSLLLVGGDIELQAGQLKAPGGSVELGGVAQAATVGLNVDGNNLHLNFPAGVQLADISLTEKAVLDTSGEGSGAIQLSGKRITLTDGSKIEANTIGSNLGGTITVTAQESLELLAGSRLLTQTIGDGAAGDVTIETGQLIVKDGSQIGSVTFSTGQGGTLSVSAAKFVELIGTSADGVDVSGLFTQTEGAGAAGNLTLKTDRLTLKDGAQVSVSTIDAAGQGGKLNVTAQQSVQLIGTSAKGNPSGLFAATQGGSGAAGDLTVKTGQLIAQDGGQVSASTFGGATGKGGTVSVTADSIQLIGTSANSQFRSGLLVGTTGSAAAGDLTVETGQLTVQNGALVSAGTLGEGQGGKLTITAKKSVQLVGISAQGQASSLLTQTSGAGTAGDLKITTGQLIVQDGAQVNVSSQGTGNAGNLEIEAGSILLDNQAALTATTKSGNGGNITLQVQDLLQLRHGSSISTTAGTDKAGGNGGNMDINAKFIVAVPEENSDITANAFEGRGGNINITTSGIFGTQFRPRLTPESDITASSEFGVNGAVNINTLDVDPSRGLATLPAELVDASGLVAQTCPTGGGLAQSELILTGRGGLPDNPSETRSSSVVWTDWRISQTSRPNRISHAAKAFPRSTAVAESQAHSPAIPFVEATGWGRNHQGEVVLMAAVSSSPKSLALASQCPR